MNVRVIESAVWNDFMPGTRPSCHAMLRVALKNTSSDTLVLNHPEAVIRETGIEAPLRKFPVELSMGDAPMDEVLLLPGAELEYTFRTRLYVAPFDGARYPKVLLDIMLDREGGEPLVLRSGPIDVQKTQ